MVGVMLPPLVVARLVFLFVRELGKAQMLNASFGMTGEAVMMLYLWYEDIMGWQMRF